MNAALIDQPGQPDDPRPGAAEPSAPVLDPESIDRLKQLDPGGAAKLVHRVLSTYQASVLRLCAQIGEALTSGDLSQVRMVAHTLKSSSASVGALQLSRLCATVERMVRESSLEHLPATVEQLQHEAHRVDAAVGRLLAE